MAKQITLSQAELVEIILTPTLPIVVRYKLKDAQGNVLYHKTALIKKTSLPQQAQDVITSFMAKLLTHVTTSEGL